MAIICHFWLPNVVETSLKEISFWQADTFAHICLQNITAQELFGLCHMIYISRSKNTN